MGPKIRGKDGAATLAGVIAVVFMASGRLDLATASCKGVATEG